MSGKHLSDVLFDYLFGTIHVSFTDEDTPQELKLNGKSSDQKTEDEPLETEKQ